jgi:hypothetical protein
VKAAEGGKPPIERSPSQQGKRYKGKLMLEDLRSLQATVNALIGGSSASNPS